MGPVGGRDQHRVVAGSEGVDQGARAPAGGVEARLPGLAHLHARGDVEDEDEAASRRSRGGALHVGTEAAPDQREEEEELGEEEQVGTEAAAVERARRNPLPEKERGDRDHAHRIDRNPMDLPATTPFFAGPAQRGAGRASDWGRPLRCRAGCGCRIGNGASQTGLSSFWPESSSEHTPKSQR